MRPNAPGSCFDVLQQWMPQIYQLTASHPPRPASSTVFLPWKTLYFRSLRGEGFSHQESTGMAIHTLQFRVVLNNSPCLRFYTRNPTRPFCEYPFCKPWTEGCGQKTKPLNPIHTGVYMHILYQSLDKVSPCSGDRVFLYNSDQA